MAATAAAVLDVEMEARGMVRPVGCLCLGIDAKHRQSRDASRSMVYEEGKLQAACVSRTGFSDNKCRPSAQKNPALSLLIPMPHNLGFARMTDMMVPGSLPTCLCRFQIATCSVALVSTDLKKKLSPKASGLGAIHVPRFVVGFGPGSASAPMTDSSS